MPVVTTSAVKSHLVGLSPYLEGLSGGGESLLSENIATATAEFERYTSVLLEERTVRMNPRAGDVYDLEHPPLTLRRMNTMRSPRWHLPHRPIIEILNCRFEFDATRPVVEWPLDNLRVDKMLGVVTLLPFTNMAGAATAGGPQLVWATVGTGVWPGGVLPQFVCIDYRAGYTDTATNPHLADVRRMIAGRAAQYTLQDIRALVPNSLNLDGFSQSFDSIQQRIDTMEKTWQETLYRFTRREKPLVAGII